MHIAAELQCWGGGCGPHLSPNTPCRCTVRPPSLGPRSHRKTVSSVQPGSRMRSQEVWMSIIVCLSGAYFRCPPSLPRLLGPPLRTELIARSRRVTSALRRHHCALLHLTGGDITMLVPAKVSASTCKASYNTSIWSCVHNKATGHIYIVSKVKQLEAHAKLSRCASM